MARVIVKHYSENAGADQMVQYKKVIELVHSAKNIIFDVSLRENVQKKGNSDYVTAVDTAVSEYLKNGLKELYPDIELMSEEEPYGRLGKTRWILDPIDGTTNLVFDFRLSSVSLGLLVDGEIVFGVVYNPFTEETFSAGRGKGAYLNGEPIAVCNRALSDSLIEFGFGARAKARTDKTFKTAQEIFMDCLDIRHICSSALAICYIAAGRSDGFLEKQLKPWDYAAASLILTEAGGIISDWAGSVLQFDEPTSVLAATQNSYAYLLKKVSSLGA